MEKILIENVGPIRECKFEVKPINIFIGPQATGKSTIAKLVYFFKSIERELLELFKNPAPTDTNDINWWYKPLLVSLRRKFMGMFGVTKAIDKSFNVKYFYKEKIWIELTLDDRKYLNVRYSQELWSKLQIWAQTSTEFLRKLQNRKKNVFFRDSGIFEIDDDIKRFEKQLRKEFNETFGKFEPPIFIPAGRALPSLLSEELNLLLPISKLENRQEPVDLLIRTFISTISLLKQKLSKPIRELVLDRKKLSLEKIDFPKVEMISKLIFKILKGEYIYEDGKEKILLKGTENEDKWVYLKFSSSGQQESLWILMIIFSLILENTKAFLIAEEPEAHLFPTAQKEMVNAFALLHNATNGGLFLTTHSPYILTSFNNLFYAYKVASETGKKEKVSKIINKEFWIDPDKVNAFYVDNGRIENIIDSELKTIKAEIIDQVSNEISEEFDKLLDIEVENEL